VYSSVFFFVSDQLYITMVKLERTSGILLHISSLPGPNGIGDIGKEAYKFVDFLYECNQKTWQVCNQ
jgi:4-alpha-glucanotransferase